MSRVRDFKLPDLGEGLTEGEILKWLVSVGDTIELNQPIVEVETAKAAVEIPAKWAGKVVQIHHPEGSVVEVGSPIIAIDTDPSGASASPAPADDFSGAIADNAAAAAAAADEPGAGLIGGPAPGGRTAVLVGYGHRTTEAKRRPRAGSAPAEAPAAPIVEAPASVAASGPALAKPPVRKLARDLGIDLAGPLRRDLDGRLRGLHLDDRLVELDRVADRDQPLQDLALGQPFAEVGQRKLLDPGHRRHHPKVRSTPSSTRSRSGRNSSSTRAAGYGMSYPVTRRTGASRE